MSEEIGRREFITQAGRAAAGAALGGGALATAGCASAPVRHAQAASAAPRGPEETLRLGFIGVGGRSKQIMRHFVAQPKVEVKALCDVRRGRMIEALDITGRGPELYEDHRELLARDDIDAVVIATPDHWHAIITIEACAAGKDVYVEKPLALCIEEGRRMVESARKHGRIVQMGSQQRSGKYYQEVRRLVREGRIGKVTNVRTWNFRNRFPGHGHSPDSDPPENMNWDRWLGPRPYVPYNRVKASGSFRDFWEYAGGVVTDWGTHHFDSVQMIMDAEAPLSASAVGGRFAIDDLTTVPDTISIIWQYPDWTLEYLNHETNGMTPFNSEYGIVFYGVEGSIYLDRSGYSIYPESDRGNPVIVGNPGVDNFVPPALDEAHVTNFLECVRSREFPNTEVEIGHRSTTVAHLGNIAFRVGRTVKWDAANERILGDDEANALLRRDYRKPWALPEV